ARTDVTTVPTRRDADISERPPGAIVGNPGQQAQTILLAAHLIRFIVDAVRLGLLRHSMPPIRERAIRERSVRDRARRGRRAVPVGVRARALRSSFGAARWSRRRSFPRTARATAPATRPRARPRRRAGRRRDRPAPGAL